MHSILEKVLLSIYLEEELKHDLNELCIYVHKLFGYCEGAWRATDLVVLTLWSDTGHKFVFIFGLASAWRADRADCDGGVLRVWVRWSEQMALADASMGRAA